MKPINTPVAIRMEFVGFDDVSGRAPGRAKGTAQDLPGTEQLIREEKMPYTRLTVTVIMSGLLSACAGVGPSPDVIAKSTQFEQTIPACKDSKECEVMWAAARDWVLSNISWKIQTISDGFIQTFSPPLGDITLAATVRKQPRWMEVIGLSSLRIAITQYGGFAAPIAGRRRSTLIARSMRQWAVERGHNDQTYEHARPSPPKRLIRHRPGRAESSTPSPRGRQAHRGGAEAPGGRGARRPAPAHRAHLLGDHRGGAARSV